MNVQAKSVMHPVPLSRELAPGFPQSMEAERAVLGAILLNNNALAVAINRLSPGDFFLRANSRIFSRMLKMAEENKPIDSVTLINEMETADELPDCEETAYVASLGDDLPRVTNIEEYCRIVRQKASLRQVIYLAQEIQDRAFAGEFSEDAPERFAALCDLKRPNDWRSVFHTFNEFEFAQPLSFAIAGFLQNNGATMIGGLSGHGKTFILLSVTKALLLGRGHRLWDLFEVDEENARILYLIPECAIEPFKHRLRVFGIYPYLAPDNERLLVRTLSKGPTPSLADPRILHAAKDCHVALDTAVRFAEGDENDVGDNRRLASDIFALLAAGARSVYAAHHSPKAFEREAAMRLENVLRGSSDIGAMLTTAWGIKQIDADRNIIHIENIKPRDFQPCGPFQIIGRPHIDDEGDFRLHKPPGQCGSLRDEHEPERDKGGAPKQAREARAANIELLRRFVAEDPKATSEVLAQRFRQLGISISAVTVRKYRGSL